MKRRDFIINTGITTAGLLMAPTKGFKVITKKPEKVIVIGGGLAGLTAAYELRKSGCDVLLLEGSDRLGGRIYTVKNVLSITELGAEWIGFSHTSVRNLCNDLQLKLTQHRFSTHRVLNNVYCKPGHYPLDEQLPAVVSGSAFSQPTNEMNFKIAGGNNQITQQLAQQLNSSQLKLNHKVIAVIDNGKQFTVQCLNGKFFKANTVICALPTPFIKSIKWEPALPSYLQQAITKTSYQTSLKIPVTFNKKIWGDDFELMSDETLHYAFNSGNANGLTFSVSGDDARKLLSLNHWERKQMITSTLKPVKGFSGNSITAINYYAGIDASKMVSYAMIDANNIIEMEPQQRLYFCGDYLTSYRGFMEAAVRSAQYVVKQLLQV